MKKFARAGGFAAAVAAFAALASLAGPTEASRADAPIALPAYLDHAGATNGPDAGAEALAASFLEAADAAVPRPRTLDELTPLFEKAEVADAEQHCLASAIYFEARGEPIGGQLAVADVVLNRVASDRYPDTICEVVTQPWQFSFVRDGVIPAADRASRAWRKAVAISEIALRKLDSNVARDVLWYHADYVAPGWGRRLTREEKIGLHIFYS